MNSPPVILVHGIWDSARRIEPLARGLMARGVGPIVTFDLKPNDGRATISALAEQLSTQVEAARAGYASERVDIVGFSMGALTARYYLQRGGGKTRVRRFVSISGPHAGTWTAHALRFAGARQMRPGSALLRDLALDPDPWGPVEVHCVYTRFDLMILPPGSSVLRAARSTHKLGVPLHRMMITDRRVFDLVARTLQQP